MRGNVGRIRTIKPEFFRHEELSSLPEITHFFAAGLLCYADDDGYFNANEGLIKADIFPLREPSVSIHGMLKQLVDVGYLRIGTNGTARRYGHITNFYIHQRVNRPTPSKIKDLHITWEDSVITHTQLSEASSEEGKGREGKGTGNREESAPQKQDTCDTRILSESVGIFQMKQQADMNRLLAVFMQKSGKAVKEAIEHMVARWEIYKSRMPELEWQYGGAYKFFTNDLWDNPELWPRKPGAKSSQPITENEYDRKVKQAMEERRMANGSI
jgi:hypothetical protein